MNNIPENEIKEIKEAENTVDELSTVFSDPTVHREAPKKKKHRLLVAIASILAVAIFAGGTVAVIKLIPEKEESTESPFVSDIKVTEVSASSLSSVTVKNEYGTLELYSEKDETKSDSSSSSTTETYSWYLKGVNKDLISTTTAESFVANAASVSAMREITEKTEAECGFDSSAITVETLSKESEKMTITVGGESPDKSGYYIKTSKDDKIYLVDVSYVDALKVEPLYFATTATMSAFTVPEGAEGYSADDGTLTSFDLLTIKSKKFSEDLVIEANSDDELSQYIGFLVKKPTKRIAENIDGIITVYKSGLATTGAYSFDVKSETLKKFGLDKPDFQMTMEIKGKTLTYKFAAQADGNYAAVNDDSKLISKVSADSLSAFVDKEIIDFYSSWICLYSIDDISALNIKVNDTKYNFGIEALSEEEAENSDDKYNISLNSKKIDCQSFQNLYQYLVSLSCSDYAVEKLNAAPQIEFEFVFKDANVGKSVVKFTKASETRYQYSVDGYELGKVTSASLNKFVKYLEKLAAGEIISDIN